METWSIFKNSSLAAVHYADASGNAQSAAQNEVVPRTADGYHTYGLLWTPTTLDWYIDKLKVWSEPTPDDMHKPMYMIANQAIYNAGQGTPSGATQLQIDYIHAYALPGVTVMGPGSISSHEDPSTGLAGMSSAGQTLQAPNDTGAALSGGSGFDTLVASHGPDILTGAGGADTFEFPVIPRTAGHVTDFTPGTDFLDLAPLFEAAGYSGRDPVNDGWLSFASDGSGDSRVYFNPHDGSNGGSAYLIATLDHVAPSSIMASHDLMFM